MRTRSVDSAVSRGPGRCPTQSTPGTIICRPSGPTGRSNDHTGQTILVKPYWSICRPSGPTRRSNESRSAAAAQHVGFFRSKRCTLDTFGL